MLGMSFSYMVTGDLDRMGRGARMHEICTHKKSIPSNIVPSHKMIHYFEHIHLTMDFSFDKALF